MTEEHEVEEGERYDDIDIDAKILTRNFQVESEGCLPSEQLPPFDYLFCILVLTSLFY